jgi:hypothetical protein
MKRRMPGFDVKANFIKPTITLVQAHIDPTHKDLVINGYGINKKQAKAFRDWLTQAMRHMK